ncbi:MAG TPA: carboxypeptidase regulatory-like domain-containing protein, partial [Pyrinomonadaceae bacterium]|nr:carboxypeptidase regulatory-like domain-containing protein [Pyrinomonadaceae bacterium]
MSRRIHSLENIRTLSPCEADWDSMRGGDRVRFCEHCAHSVHDLSAMTRKDALHLVRKSKGQLCVRYVTLPSGQVKTLPPPGGLHQISRRASRVAAGAFGAALTLSSSAAAQAHGPRGSASFDTPARVSSRDAAHARGLVGSGATLSVTLFDPNGAVVPFASVVLVGEGFNLGALQRDAGVYHFAGVGSGTYTLRASAEGFQTAEQGVTFQGDEETGIELQLGLASFEDEVIVVERVETVTMGTVAVATVEPSEPLVKAASEDDLREVKRLLADGADARVRDAATRTTALDEAVERGNIAMVRALLDAGADARARDK